jgi:histidinol phosphatase-like enzyme (inositol monophosphatase family)
MVSAPLGPELGSFIDELAQSSGEVIMPFFRSRFAQEDKGGAGHFDPVTEADRAAEAIMRQMINATFPAHGIVGEEFGNERADAAHVWVLDPIDGTRAFISGLPSWGTLIGLTHHGKPVHGMMHQPFTGERFSGDGASARWRRGDEEQVLRTRACTGLAQATLMTTDPALLKGDDRTRYDAVERDVRLARYGCDCYAYAMLAMGQVDLVIEAGLKPYDIVALIPIIEGAGGIVTNWSGGSAAGGGQIAASGNAALHELVLKRLA